MTKNKPKGRTFRRKKSKSYSRNVVDAVSGEGSNSPTIEHFAEMKDVTPKRVKYLWEPWIPLGCVTIIDGNPGVGKSHLTVEIAAAVTRGRTCGTYQKTRKSRVLFLCAEDDPERVLQPRLTRQRANLERIRYMDKPLFLDAEIGIPAIKRELKKHRARLVIIDPIVAFMPAGTNMSQANEIRAFLLPITELARELDIAVLIVRHLRKAAAEQAILGGMGSIDFVAAARSVSIIAKNPDHPDERIFAHAKCNYAELQQSLSFELRKSAGARAPTLRWTGTSHILADELTRSAESDKTSKVDIAQDLLKSMLAEGPCPSTRVYELAKAAGIPKRTLERGKEKLGVISGGGPGSKWSLP